MCKEHCCEIYIATLLLETPNCNFRYLTEKLLQVTIQSNIVIINIVRSFRRWLLLLYLFANDAYNDYSILYFPELVKVNIWTFKMCIASVKRIEGNYLKEKVNNLRSRENRNTVIKENNLKMKISSLTIKISIVKYIIFEEIILSKKWSFWKQLCAILEISH